MVRMRVAFSEDGRDFSRRDWSALVDADPGGTFFHYPAFLKLYWEEFGETPEHLLLAFGEADDGSQLAAVAFERIDDTIRFLGGTEVTDYMGPVGVPDAQEAFAKELWPALLTRDDWRVADLHGLPEDRPWLALLRDAAAAQGLAVEETEDQNGVAPFLPLAPTWEGYLEGLPAKLRHEIRRKAKKLEAEAGPYRASSRMPPRSPVARPVRRAPSDERGPEGRVHGAGHGDLLPAPRRGVPGRRRVPADVHRGRRRARRRHDRLRVQRDVLPVQLGVRPEVGDARAGDGPGGGGHPIGDRGGSVGVRPAQGRYAYKYRFGAHARSVRRLVARR